MYMCKHTLTSLSLSLLSSLSLSIAIFKSVAKG